ncbi:MAG: nuclear transport factor 2 family protein, partial [Geminicoccaceae bacterium]
AFRAMPDLRADVQRWSANDDVLFIEMSFFATIGGRVITWRNVDRFLFRNGVAVERTAFFDPARVQRAFLANPRGWFQLARLRSGI